MRRKTFKLKPSDYSKYFYLLAYEKQAKGFKRWGFFLGLYMGGGIFTILAAVLGNWGAVVYFFIVIVLVVTYPIYKDLLEEGEHSY